MRASGSSPTTHIPRSRRTRCTKVCIRSARRCRARSSPICSSRPRRSTAPTRSRTGAPARATIRFASRSACARRRRISRRSRHCATSRCRGRMRSRTRKRTACRSRNRGETVFGRRESVGAIVEAGVLENPWNAPPDDAYAWSVAPETAPANGTEVVISFKHGWPTLRQAQGDIGERSTLGRPDRAPRWCSS